MPSDFTFILYHFIVILLSDLLNQGNLRVIELAPQMIDLTIFIYDGVGSGPDIVFDFDWSYKGILYESLTFIIH